MASSNTDSPGTIYRWIERKPLTEAVIWTSREKFWLITAACHYGTHDWKSVAQVVRNAGEPYRPREWYTPKSCERQFKILVSNLSKEVKSLPLIDMLQHIAEGLKNDYIRDANKSKDTLKSKYCNLFSVLNRVKQGNLSRNEVVSLYSQARRNEIEGKQYMDQLMTRQNASLASENSSSGLIEEQPIKWNTPSAPLLTSLLRSRNTIPVNRTATTIASLLQSPGGTSRTRSGKLLPLTPSIRTTQGTPTLSKLLEAPANPYIPSPSPPQSTQKNKLSEIGTEKLANTSRKENSQSTSLNRVRVDNVTTLGSLNQINKSDLSASKKQISKSPASVVKNGSKANSNVVSLLSDSESDEETKNTSLKSLLGDKKDTSSRLEPRATRSQTRAEGSFKQLNNTKLSDGKKERESLRQQSGGSQINETQIIDDDLIELDQIEVEPLSSVQDEIQSQTPSKLTRSSLQKLRLLSPGDNLLTSTKVNSKEISNKMLEEISANFVLNSTSRTLATEYKCLLGQPDKSDNSESLIPVDRSACKDAIMIRKESQLAQNTQTSYNGKLLKQKGIIEIKAANIRCIDSRNDSKFLSYNNQPIVVVNKIKKPFNIQFASEQRNKTDDIQVSNTVVKNSIRVNNSSQNVVKLIDSNCSLAADEVIIIDDDININEDSTISMTTKELLSKGDSKTLPSTVSSNLKPTVHQIDDKKSKNEKSPWNMFGKTQTILDSSKKQSHQDSVSKSGTNSNINESNNRFIKELDFDFDQSISQTSLSELYNGVDGIVEMHSFDNEELNSLIECGSLDSNDTEESIDLVGADQGDSSVSESDSTIGAFDTFAQITRVPQKSFASKDIKLNTKNSNTTNQGVKHLKESFGQSEKIYDDQTSTASSVPGIPVLKGVLLDVMSQISLDSVASHKIPNTDVVEVSSEEEVLVDPKAHHLHVKQIQTQEKEVKSYKLSKNDNEFIKIHEIEAKMHKGVNMKQGINNIKPLNIEMPQCIIVKNLTSDVVRTACNKILEFKEDIAQKYDTQDFEMRFVSNTGNIREDNESYEAEVIQPQELTVKIDNKTFMKETERIKKEFKENEERKKKDDEKKKKEDNERKKREDDERKKREEDERKKKEDDRMKRELEKKRQYELFVKKKNEEEERNNKENERKKKEEEEERKIKDLQEKMKAEKQKKLEKEKKDEEKDSRMIREKLKGFYNSVKDNENYRIPMNAVVVKEEKIDNDYCGFYTHGNEGPILHGEVIKEELIDEEFINEQILDEQNIVHEQIVHEQIIKEELIGEEEIMNDELIVDEEIVNNERLNERIVNEEIINEEVIDEEVIDDDSCTDNEFGDELRTQSSEDDNLPMKTNLGSHTEPTKIRDLELQSREEFFKRRNKIKNCKNSEDLDSIREIKITARNCCQVNLQRGYFGFPKQTVEQQSNVAEVAKKQRAVEAETQRKSKEADEHKAKEENELISGALKEYKIKRAKEYELAENIAVKKLKGVELRKNIVAEELVLKGLDKRTLKKLKEPENNQSVGHRNVNLPKNYGDHPVHFKKKNDNVETDTNIEQGLIESRKAATKSNIETFNVKERGIKKLVGSEGKSTKGIETMSTEVKMITRTRGLKGEEKLKESNVFKNVSTKLRSQIKSPGSSSSSASSTSEENPSIPSYEYKKQTKNTDGTSKRNSTLNTLYDDKNNRDLNIDSSVIVRKENLICEVIGIPRTRTRSSSFKQGTISETRSSKQDQNNGAAVIPKETVGTKTIVSTSTHPDHRTTRSKSPTNRILNKHTFNNKNCGKTLIIPVVMLATSDIPLHKVRQPSGTYFVKRPEIKPAHGQIQKQVVTTTHVDKPPPKKRGRKSRINVQNEKLQESNSSNKTTSQNVAKMNTLIKEVEPLAKRTRRSLGLRGSKNNSTNKQLDIAQPSSSTVQIYKEQFVNEVSIEKRQTIIILTFIYGKICEDYNTILTLIKKEVTSVSPQCVNIFKDPIELRDIERHIVSGKFTELGDLIVNLMLFSNNAVMMNKSSAMVFREISKFQSNLQENCQKLLKVASEHYSDCQDGPKIFPPLSITDYSSYNVVFPEEDSKECHHIVDLNKSNELCFDTSSDESTDSDDSDTPPLPKRRKKNISDFFSSESD